MRVSNWRCKACQKTAFKSEGRALSAIEYIQEINPTGTTPQRAYPCPYGNGWHLTSKPARERESA